MWGSAFCLFWSQDLRERVVCALLSVPVALDCRQNQCSFECCAFTGWMRAAPLSRGVISWSVCSIAWLVAGPSGFKNKRMCWRMNECVGVLLLKLCSPIKELIVSEATGRPFGRRAVLHHSRDSPGSAASANKTGSTAPDGAHRRE
jgi:hypothetical protein